MSQYTDRIKAKMNGTFYDDSDFDLDKEYDSHSKEISIATQNTEINATDPTFNLNDDYEYYVNKE